VQREPRPDPILGFYRPDSRIWHINREAVLLGAGPCALLLQLAHPHVAEGVAQHSRFLEDPASRLRHTLRTTLGLVFGDGRAAERAVARLNGVHATVRGDVDDPEAVRLAGASYRALDPALLLWVQATLIVTSVQAYERWVRPLPAADKDAFWQEARSVGPRIGIPLDASPSTWPALLDYWNAMLAPDGPIQVTPTARRLGQGVMRSPFAWLPQPLYDLLALPSLALLPDRLRAAYGLPWGDGRRRLASAIEAALRVYIRALPRTWRSVPNALAADRRARNASSGSGNGSGEPLFPPVDERIEVPRPG
jgi:uncharacterized protein (DUF2236 family)